MASGEGAGPQLDHLDPGLVRNHLAKDVVDQQLTGDLTDRERKISASALHPVGVFNVGHAGQQRNLWDVIAHHRRGEQGGAVAVEGEDDDPRLRNGGAIENAHVEYVADHIDSGAFNLIDDPHFLARSVENLDQLLPDIGKANHHNRPLLGNRSGHVV